MSREKPKNEYITEVTRFGTGAKIKGYKAHIGKRVLVKILRGKENERV